MKIELDTDWVCMISHESAPTSQWSRKDAEWSHARPRKSTVSADHVQIALGPSSKVQRLPVVIWSEGQNIKTIHKYVYLLRVANRQANFEKGFLRAEYDLEFPLGTA